MSELIVSISVVAASLLGSLAALPVMNGLSGSRDQRSFRQALKDGVIDLLHKSLLAFDTPLTKVNKTVLLQEV